MRSRRRGLRIPRNRRRRRGHHDFDRFLQVVNDNMQCGWFVIPGIINKHTKIKHEINERNLPGTPNPPKNAPPITKSLTTSINLFPPPVAIPTPTINPTNREIGKDFVYRLSGGGNETGGSVMRKKGMERARLASEHGGRRGGCDCCCQRGS